MAKTLQHGEVKEGGGENDYILRDDESCCRPKCRASQVFILILAFIVNVQSASCVQSMGVFLVEFMEYFRTSKSAVTWIAGANLGVSFIVGPVLGTLLKKFGSMNVGVVAALITATGMVLAAFINNLTSLYFTYGLMSGVGPCAYYAIANSTVPLYFKERRAVACAFALTAYSVGGFFWPPLSRWLIDRLCWQGTLLVFAAIHVQTVIAFVFIGILNKNREREMGLKIPDETSERITDVSENISSEKVTKEVSLFSRLNCMGHWLVLPVLFSIGIAMAMLLHMSVLVYTPARGKEMGIDKLKSAYLVSIVNFAGGFCRIPAGFLGDLRYFNRGYMLTLAVAIGGVLSVLSRFLSTFTQLAIFSALYGCFSAVFLAIQTVVLSDISGLQHLPVAMGILVAGHGASNLVLHPTAGALLDSTGTSNAIFTLAGFLGIFGSALILVPVTLTIRRKNKRNRVKYRTDPSTVEEICLKDS